LRYGGDEFALLMIDSEQGHGRTIAHRIENGLQTDQGKPPVSVSIASASTRRRPHAHELIEAADRQTLQLQATENRRTVPTRAARSAPKKPVVNT